MYSNNNMNYYNNPTYNCMNNDYQQRTPMTPVTNYSSYNYSPVSMQSYGSPCTQNKSVSSGYYSSASNNSSFSNSPAYGNYASNVYNYGTYQTSPFSSNTYKPAPLPVLNAQAQKSTKSNKRQRSEYTDALLDQVFNGQVAPNEVQQTKKLKSEKEIALPLPKFEEICNLDFDDESFNGSMFGDNKKRILTKDQRKAANQRERKRMGIMNDGFNGLRAALPISTGRKRRKMSRLDIVIGAMEYIDYLTSLLETPGNGPVEVNFEAYQNALYMYDE